MKNLHQKVQMRAVNDKIINNTKDFNYNNYEIVSLQMKYIKLF